MDSTVKARPNHYQTLGLKPGASAEEIAQAFAREIGLFRPRGLGGIAEVSIAYETLRNPAKRRAYDATLGLTREPAVAHAPSVAREPVFLDLAALAPAPEPAAERALGSFIATSLRAPAEPAAHESAPVPAAQAEPAAHEPTTLPMQAEPQPRAEAAPAFEPRPGEDGLHGIEVSPIEWRRTGITVGAVVAVVASLAAFAGWWSVADIQQPQQTERGVTLALPPAEALPDMAASAPAPVRSVAQVRPERPRRAVAMAPPVERAPASPQLAAAEVAQIEPAQPAPSEPAEAAIEPAAAEAPAAAPTPASLPLPNRVVARTIERIGYVCGQVASASAVDGAAGVFKVTCTSGHAYQAKPVRGRYHFRRWGRQ